MKCAVNIKYRDLKAPLSCLKGTKLVTTFNNILISIN